MKIEPQTRVFSTRIKIGPKPIVYSIRLENGSRMRNRPKTIVYSTTTSIRLNAQSV